MGQTPGESDGSSEGIRGPAVRPGKPGVQLSRSRKLTVGPEPVTGGAARKGAHCGGRPRAPRPRRPAQGPAQGPAPAPAPAQDPGLQGEQEPPSSHRLGPASAEPRAQHGRSGAGPGRAAPAPAAPSRGRPRRQSCPFPPNSSVDI